MKNEPDTIDGEIIEEMKSLELMIAFHKKVTDKGLKIDFYYPKELRGHLDEILTETAWENERYDTLRTIYSEAWVNYYVRNFGGETFYTVQDFAEFFQIK